MRASAPSSSWSPPSIDSRVRGGTTRATQATVAEGLPGTVMIETSTFSVGLEQGPNGSAHTRVHALDLLGCTAEGTSPEAALAAFGEELAAWLGRMQAAGEPVPPPDAELEIAVDEWVRTDADVAAGQSDVCFDADLQPLDAPQLAAVLRRLGDLRGRLLRRVRRLPDPELERDAGGYTVRQALDELARAQWWLLTRLGASPLAEVPDRPLARLDTAMALVVDRFTTLPAEPWTTPLDIDGERWTPRKVLRRLLWLERSLGRAVEDALAAGTETGAAAR